VITSKNLSFQASSNVNDIIVAPLISTLSKKGHPYIRKDKAHTRAQHIVAADPAEQTHQPDRTLSMDFNLKKTYFF